jgi:hypothetical protein
MTTCMTQRITTTYYVRLDGREVTVAQATSVLHSEQSALTERTLTTLGGTVQNLTADQYIRLRKRFEGFNAVRSASDDLVECDDDHSEDAA